MPKQVKELQYRGGFIGSPTPSDATGVGFPDGENVCLDPSGQRLVPMPGFRRTMHLELQGVADASEFDEHRVFLIDPQSLGMDHGVGIVVMDMTGRRTMGVGYNGASKINMVDAAPTAREYINIVTLAVDFVDDAGAGDSTLTHGSTDYAALGLRAGMFIRLAGTDSALNDGIFKIKSVATVTITLEGQVVESQTSNTTITNVRNPIIKRHGHHDYITPINFRNSTLFNTSFDEQHVFDGSIFRMSGIRAPQFAPGVGKDVTAIAEVAADEVWHPFDGLHAGTVIEIADVSDTDPELYATGPFYGGNAASPSMADAGATTVTFNNEGGGPGGHSTITRSAGDWTTDGFGAEGPVNFWVTVASSVSNNGVYHVERIRSDAGRKHQLVLDEMDRVTDEVVVNAATVVDARKDKYVAGRLRVNDRIPNPTRDLFFSNVSGTISNNIIKIRIRVLSKHGDISAGGSRDGIPIDAVFGAPFSILISDRAQPGSPGASMLKTTTLLEFPVEGPFDPREWKEKTITGIVPIPSPPMTYGSIGLRLNKEIPAFRFHTRGSDKHLMPVHLEDISEITAVGGTTDLNINPDGFFFVIAWIDGVTGLESAPSPLSQRLDLEPNDAARVEISGRDPSASDGVENEPPFGTERFRIYMHALDWGLDFDGRPMFRRAFEDNWDAIQPDEDDGLKWVSLANIGTRDEILAGASPNWGGGAPPAARAAIVDINRVLLAGQENYSVGTIGVTNGSHIVTRVASGNTTTTPVWGPHLEQRALRIGSDEAKYFIIKAIDADKDGVYESLWIVGGSGGDEPYQGSTNAGATYQIFGLKNRVWYSSKTSRFGIQPEQFGLFNFVDVEMPDDEIVALGHAGDHVLIVGRHNVYTMLQNKVSIDDLPQTGPAFSQPRILKGSLGCIAGRTLVQLPGRQAAWLAEGYQWAIANSESVQVHPIGRSFAGFFRDTDRVRQEDIAYAHAVYVPHREWFAIFLISDHGGVVALNGSDRVGLTLGDPGTFLIEGPNDPHADPGLTQYTGAYSEACADYGALRAGTGGDATALAHDFSYLAVLDIRHNVGYLGRGFNITSTMSRTTPCAGSGRSPTVIYGGDVTLDSLIANAGGHISRLFVDEAMGLGHPGDQIEYRITEVTSSSNVALTPVDGSGANLIYGTDVAGRGLSNLQAVHIANDVATTSVILRNTHTSIVLAGTFPSPAVGDTVLIAPMLCSVLFKEDRFEFPANIEAIQPNVRFFARTILASSATTEPRFTVDVYGASGNGNFAITTSLATKRFNATDLYAGDGRKFLAAHRSKALAVRLKWFNVCPTEVGPIRAYYNVHSADFGKTESQQPAGV